MIKGYEVGSFSHLSVLNKWIVPSAIYAALASGAGNPIRCQESSCDISVAYLVMTVLLILITPFIRVRGRVLLQLIVLSFGFLILGMIGYTSSIPSVSYTHLFGFSKYPCECSTGVSLAQLKGQFIGCIHQDNAVLDCILISVNVATWRAYCANLQEAIEDFSHYIVGFHNSHA